MIRITLALLSFASFLLIGVLVDFVARREGRTKQLTVGYILVALFPALWSLGYTFMYLTENKEIAWIFYRLSAFGWCLGPSAIVYFTYLLYNQYAKRPTRVFYTILIFIPFPILLFGALTRRLMAYDFAATDLGWQEFINPGSVWVQTYISLVILSFCLALILLIILWKKARLNKHKLQAKLIILPNIFISPIPFALNMFLPAFGIHFIPPVGHLIVSSLIIFMGLAIIRYPVLSINPKFVIDKIILNMHDVLLLTGLSWDIVMVNSAGQAILEYDPDSLKGKPLSVLVPERMLEKWKNMGRRQQDSGETELLTRQGKKIPFSYVIQKVKDKCDDPVGYLFFARDIREMRRLEKLTDELQKSNRKLEKMSITDSLTKVFNRQKIEMEIQTELDRFNRYSNVFSLIMFDLDFFKEVNDEFGHDIGDKVLIEVTEVVKTEIRSTDLLARWGGEEFIVLCPGINLENVLQQAERIRRQIEHHSFGIIENMTISFGVTEVTGEDTLETILKRADKALYQAKDEGRNRVCRI